MGSDLFQLSRATIFANSPDSAATTSGYEAVQDDIWLTAVKQNSDAAVYTALKLTFSYMGNRGVTAGNNGLTFQTKMPRVYPSLKNGWSASRWVYDYIKKTGSCIVSYKGSGAPCHTGTQIGICDIEAYLCGDTRGDTCAITVEFFAQNGKAVCEAKVFELKKTPVMARIQHFTPKRLKVDMFAKPALKYGAASSTGKPALKLTRYKGGHATDKLPAVMALSTRTDTYTESNDIYTLTAKQSDTLEYELKATVIIGGKSYEDTAVCEVKMMQPRINGLEATSFEDGTIQVEYDTSYVSALWIDGETATDIEHGKTRLPCSRNSVNLLCYGYGRYVSGTLHFPYISDELIVRVRNDLAYDEASGACEIKLDWIIIGADEVTLNRGNTIEALSHIGAKTLTGNSGELSMSVKKSGLIYNISLQTPVFSLQTPADRQMLSRRTARRLITLLAPMHDLLLNQSPSASICLKAAQPPLFNEWSHNRWPQYLKDSMESLNYMSFFYGSESVAFPPKQQYLDSSCRACKDLGICLGANRVSLYQSAMMLYLSYRLLIQNSKDTSAIQKQLELIAEYEKAQYFELFRRAGCSGEIKYRLNKNDRGNNAKICVNQKTLPEEFTGIKLFCFLAEYYRVLANTMAKS